MITIVLLAMFMVAFFASWNVGSHDAANSMGTSVGSRIITVRRAVFLLSIFVVLGAVLQGNYIMNTISRGIVKFENENAAAQLAENIGLPAGVAPTPFSLLPWAAVAATLSASIWVLLCTYLGLPVSTGHSLVASLVGAGLAISMLGSPTIAAAGISVNTAKFTQILISWVITPLGAIGFAFLFYHVTNRMLKRVRSFTTLNTIYSTLTVATACYMAYAFGVNDVSHGVGVALAVDPSLNVSLLALFGAVAMICGAVMFSSRMIETIGKKFTILSPSTAFAAQFGAAMTVLIFAWLGMPVSSSHAIVGGVIGAGLVRGTSTISGKKIGRTSLAWVLTPFVTMSISFALVAIFVVI